MDTFRLVREDDAEEILALYAPFVRDTAISFETEVPTLVMFRSRINEIRGDYPYIVAERGGEIVGYAYAHRHMERAAYGWNVELSIYIRPADSGRGLGTRLYQALLALLKLQGIQNVFSGVTASNPASIALHNRFDFKLCGTWHKTGYKLGEWRDVLWFEKWIGDHENPPMPFRPIGTLDPEAVERILQSASAE